MVKSALAANGNDQTNPAVQMDIFRDTSIQNGAVVTDVLEKATTDKEEDEAIKKIAGQVKTDDDKMASVNKMIKEESARNKQNINFSEAIKDLEEGTFDKMMVGGNCDGQHPCPAEKAQEQPCGAGKPCPAEKIITAEKPCGGDKPCPAEKSCGKDKPCPAEKTEKKCAEGKPCPAEPSKMVIDPNTADMVPANSSGKTEKQELNHFSIDQKVSDSIGFIQQFAMK